MKKKTITYEDIRKQFVSFLKILADIPFDFFFDNEKICPDKFAVLFNYLEPTLPILPCITMLRTENPYITVPFFMNNPFFDYEKNKDGFKTIKFNSVGYYTGMNTSFNADFIVKNDAIKNYSLMYKYLKVLKNCVSIIDDFFFLCLMHQKNYLNPIYKSISAKTVKILNELLEFYGNYILVKKKGISRYPANDRIYIQDTQPNTQVVYNFDDNPLFPITADLTLARGGEGTNLFETINNIAAEIIGGEIEREFDRTLRENAHRVVAECTELLRAAT